MARNQGRMALYEAIRKSQKKIAGTKSAQYVPKTKIATDRKKIQRPERKAPKPVESSPAATGSQWPPRDAHKGLKAKSFKIVSLKNIIIVAAIVLTAFVAVNIAKKFTQASSPFSGENTSPAPVENKTSVGVKTDSQEPVVSNVSETAGPEQTDEKEMLLEPIGGNVIVIATYGTERDLKPVQEYFADNGIGTEILARHPYYFLITKERYGNPNRSGSDGWIAKQKIKDIGAGYKAPKGYEPFGTRPFQDAYGMKLQ